jgi:hydroxymethylpyrimidine pyrophosphatase-like HAD family hydrolase
MNTLTGFSVFIDVDDTLVSWDEDDNGTLINTPLGMRKFKIFDDVVSAIKLHKLRGHNVIVWSAGGGEWARTVVDSLGLTEYVDLCISKPSWFWDDIEASKILLEENRRHSNKGK